MIGHQIFLVGNLGYVESSMKNMYTDVKVLCKTHFSVTAGVKGLKGKQNLTLTSVLLSLFASFLFLFWVNFFQISCLDGLGKVCSHRRGF